MSPQILFGLLLLAGTAAAWSRTDHWQTAVQTRGFRSTSFTTSSISVVPTDAATPIASNISTSLMSGFEVTVTDLFYASNASGLCTPPLEDCNPSTTPRTTTSSTITTKYYALVVISNPASCTRTSFAYTSARSLDRPSATDMPDFEEQATQSAHALAVTTYVSTLSTNLGGQDVTTSVCEVYLREGALVDIEPDDGVHFDCVDPRVYYCSVAMARASHFASGGLLIFDPSTSAACQTDQRYPPARITVGGGGENGTSGVSAGFTFRVEMGWLAGVAGGAVAMVAML
ncbi:hypothetical protein N657DRAFT_650396 [Parathielavia appendiculata]|uniref:Uncharacterized protein n=1 Tax=Parathielavia appendiculata TaxID=2587402 RepID=A0AAN6TSJ8_9PEZI|nr:hypothetical protein N657DRAFT_650396 [Parathielavia appendiculata]